MALAITSRRRLPPWYYQSADTRVYPTSLDFIEFTSDFEGQIEAIIFGFDH